MTITDRLYIPLAIRNQLNTFIADIFWNGSWHFPAAFSSAHPEVVLDIEHVVSSKVDKLIWCHSPNGEFSCKWAYDFYRAKGCKVAWGKEPQRHYLPQFR